MKGYTYGDRLIPQWNVWNYGGGGGYGNYSNSYNYGKGAGGYNNGYNSGYGYPYNSTANYPWGHSWTDYWNNQGTFAPPFNPYSHFETPYYEYGNRDWWWFNNYAANSKNGYWGYKGYEQEYPRWALLVQKAENGTVDVEDPETAEVIDFIKNGTLPPPPPPAALMQAIANGTRQMPEGLAQLFSNESNPFAPTKGAV